MTQSRHIALTSGAVLLAAILALAGPGPTLAAAPTPTDPALAVDGPIELGSDPTMLQEGDLFLWFQDSSHSLGLGPLALSSTTTGSANIALGYLALGANTTGSANIAVGQAALRDNRNGDENTGVGFRVLVQNYGGSHNTAVGSSALSYNTEGSFNTGVGSNALRYSAEGSFNTGVGYQALYENSAEGHRNTAIGALAMRDNTSGAWNTAIGVDAMRENEGGHANVALGFEALLNNTEGDDNVALGKGALANLGDGSRNIAIGEGAGSALMAGGAAAVDSSNILIGSPGVDNDVGVIRLGEPGIHAATFIAGIRGLAFSGDAVVIDANHRLGIAASSARFKDEIRDMGDQSSALMDLRPVSFRYKRDAATAPETWGLIAEEVAEILPGLVGLDEGGEPLTVRYHLLPAMLLNEIQRQEREIELLRTRLEVLEGKRPPLEVPAE